MLINFLQLAIGLPMLYFGGDFLITGSIRLGQKFRVSPFIIGATVVGFGTSAPELAVSVLAGFQGAPELALGNVIGSNIANVGLVLGLTAFLIPLTIGKKRLKSEAPAFMLTTFLIMFLVWNFNLNRWEGGFMLLLLFIYLWLSFRKKEESEIEIEEETRLWGDKGIFFQFLLVVIGLVLLILGARFLVDGAVGIAKTLGVSEWFIGISIVALGTSLPEIVSSIMAARRGHGELAIGNVFGSNIFNILMVLGTTSLVKPLNIQEPIHADLIFTTGLSCLLIFLIWMENALTKKDGIILLLCYCTYIGVKGAGGF
ncbi:MAG: sodium:calcium antiporter [Nitrospinaceae bacterium]|nr:MAG: sodium:calcium antiporter [Nitrospinaceae bacterium]